jgi:1,4-dihydroxy-2-naphthoyl-CoA hydrolase
MAFTHVSMGLNEHLDFHITDASSTRVVLEFDVSPVHLQEYGQVHGGVYCAVVEQSASLGADLAVGTELATVGVANQTDFLRPCRDGKVTAVATPIHQGRLQQLWQVIITNSADKVLARGQVRFQNLPLEAKQR